MDSTYCVRCKTKTGNAKGSEHKVTTKNGRLMLKSKCSSCGSGKCKFLKK